MFAFNEPCINCACAGRPVDVTGCMVFRLGICVKITQNWVKLTQNPNFKQFDQFPCQPDPGMGQAPWYPEPVSILTREVFFLERRVCF